MLVWSFLLVLTNFHFGNKTGYNFGNKTAFNLFIILNFKLFWRLVRQLAYTTIISRITFSLMVKGKFGKISKSLKILWAWLPAKFYFAFNISSLTLTAPFVKNSHVLVGISQTWKYFITKFGPQVFIKIGKVIIKQTKF